MAIIWQKAGIRQFCAIFLVLVISQSANRVFGQEIEKDLKTVPSEWHDSLYYEYFKTYRQTDVKLAKTYALKAYNSSIPSVHPVLFSKIVNALAYSYVNTNQRDSAIYFCRIGIKHAEAYKQDDRLIFFFNRLGNLFERYDQYDSALAYYDRSYTLSRKTGKQLDEAIAKHNIGLVYYHLENYNEALDNLLQAIKIKIDNQIEEGLELNYLNVGMIYSDQGLYDQALEYLHKAQGLCAKCETSVVADINYRIGYAKRNKSGMKDALPFYTKAIELARQIGDKRVLAHALLDVGEYKSEIGDYKESVDNLDEVLSIAKSISLRRLERDCNLALYLTYKKTNKLDKAILHQSRYIELKDSIFNEKMANNMKDIQLNAHRKLSEEIISQKNTELRNSQKFLVMALCIALLAVLIIVLLYMYYRKGQKVNQVVQKRLNSEVSKRTVELERALSELKQSHVEYDRLLYRISHDINGPIATLIGLANISALENNPAKWPEYFAQIASTGQAFLAKLRKVSVISELRNRELVAEPVHIRDIINNAIYKQKRFPHFPLINIQTESLTNGFELVSDHWSVEFVLCRLVENAYEYFRPQEENKYIKVRWYQNEAYSTIEVEDNGSGILSSAKDNLFQLFFVASDKHGSGLGLFMARLACQRIGAKIYLVQEAGPTVFRIVLPNKPQNEMWIDNTNDPGIWATGGR